MLSAERDKLMYNALFLLAYHVCLRMSELAHYQNIDDVLQYHQLFCVMEHSSPRSLSIAFLNFEYRKYTKGVCINSLPYKNKCPVNKLTAYLERRRGKPVAPFSNMD